LNTYILFNGPQWPDIGDEMNTTNTTHFAVLMAALLMTLAVNGGMLWSSYFRQLTVCKPATS
jgi:hypothetical protein